MAATQVLPFPEDLEVPGVETRRPVTAKMDVNPTRLDHWRGRAVSIDLVAERLRIVRVKQLFVEANLAGFGVHTNGKEVVAILRRRGQPDLAAHHHRGGPAAIRNLRFPFDVVRLAPMQRQAAEFLIARSRDMPVTTR